MCIVAGSIRRRAALQWRGGRSGPEWAGAGRSGPDAGCVWPRLPASAQKMIYIVCVATVRVRGAGDAFSSRSSPLQIWASIIIDPAPAVGGRYFLPLILGRGGPAAAQHIY